MSKTTRLLSISAALCLMSGCGSATYQDQAAQRGERDTLTPATISPEPTPPRRIGGPALQAPSTQPAAIRGPRLEQARLVAKGDGLGVDLKVAAREGAQVTLTYVWTLNGKVVSTADSISGLKRGDNVSVDITPNDGIDNGPTETLSLVVANCAPMITPNKQMEIDSEGFLTYQVLARDPEDDKMTYSLIKAPPGMDIDAQTGKVTWDAQSVLDGDYSATVRVTDPQGASADFTFSVRLSREGAA
ncbi:MAG: Ig domain-containing protein [Acidobacteriota bacterium]